MTPKFRVVTATRESQQGFFSNTALGRSLALTVPIHPNVEVRLFANNTAGLPAVYNIALRESASDPAILVFVHDDVYFCDFFWPNHILWGLATFDIIGVAGNRRRLPKQSAWNTVDDNRTWDDREQLSGVLAHGPTYPPDKLWIFGPPCQEVKLLDGVILAARSETLLAKNVGFDERFDFHFYDMDFCRQAESQKLRMGTWIVSLIHMSLGNSGSPSWKQAYATYLDKWNS
jgi:hypothetical protein